MTNLTIAQRAVLAEKEKTDKYLKGREEAREALAWEGIDLLGFERGDQAADDDWGTGYFVSAPATKAPTPTPPQ
jgi:hypothetical protein